MKAEERKIKQERITKLTKERQELLEKAERQRLQIIRLHKELGNRL